MSETQRDPDRIYLEPAPYSPEGRLWCEDDVWPLDVWPPEDRDGPGGVEYVRADLHAAEIARLTRELEEARERERALREALMTISMRCYEAVMQTPLLEHQSMHALAGACKQDADAALVRLDLRWDPREEAEWVRRRPVVEIATRLKDEVLALSTPQEANGICGRAPDIGHPPQGGTEKEGTSTS